MDWFAGWKRFVCASESHTKQQEKLLNGIQQANNEDDPESEDEKETMMIPMIMMMMRVRRSTRVVGAKEIMMN